MKNKMVRVCVKLFLSILQAVSILNNLGGVDYRKPDTDSIGQPIETFFGWSEQFLEDNNLSNAFLTMVGYTLKNNHPLQEKKISQEQQQRQPDVDLEFLFSS